MREKKIPKKIHYCWFGKGEKPDLVKTCIKSWKTKLRNYEIIEWNEENFDIESNIFVKEAYVNKKYAFVSDYVRVYALYNQGGIYLDTDVEVIKNFDDYLNNESFWGFEVGNFIATSTIGAAKGNILIKYFLDSYIGKSFLNDNGSFNVTTNVKIVSEIFKNLGVKLNGEYQQIKDFAAIYPIEIFSPYDYRYFINNRNEDTVCIHHYYKSWLPLASKIKCILKKSITIIIGKERVKKYIYDKRGLL